MPAGDNQPSLPEGWEVWSDDGQGRAVYVFRPDVFEGQSFPAACLPTLYVSTRPPDQRRRRAGHASTTWHVSLFLEPEVRVRSVDERHETRGAAVAAAVDAAAAFTAGDIEFRAAYQMPREDYLTALERLTGRDA
ncbi:MAG: DUF5820 family protein [Halobacteriaceae archaeon]